MTRLLRWLVPAVLAVGAVAGAVVAWGIERAASSGHRADSTALPLVTPVLSVRRLPTIVAAPLASRQLIADLDALAEHFPEDLCLTVAGPAVSFAHRADVPMIPASAQKLLTATAALEILGAEAPVLDQVERTLRESDNPTADALLREVGGAGIVAEVVADIGTPQVIDGTGLSQDNRVTCTLLVELLRRPGTGDLLVERLPVAGQSGTLADRFLGTNLVGVLRAKTGMLTSVVALAGVVDDEDPPLTFALLVNTPPGTPVPSDIERLLREVAEVLVRWPHVPNAHRLGPKVLVG